MTLIDKDEALAALETVWRTMIGGAEVQRKVNAAIRAIPARGVGVPTEAQIASACLSYDHSFGLMDGPQRVALMHQAREWLHAWRKEFAVLAALAPTDAAQAREAALAAIKAGFWSAAPGEWRVSDIERVTDAILRALEQEGR